MVYRLVSATIALMEAPVKDVYHSLGGITVKGNKYNINFRKTMGGVVVLIACKSTIG